MTQATARGQAPLVLLVEDDRDARELMTLGLEFAGFRVTAVHNGLVALERIAALRPHVVVTDLALPGMDGLELCRRLKSGGDTAHLPVIAVTGRSTERDVAVARAAGCDRVLTKPCSPDTVRDVIYEVLAEVTGDVPPRLRGSSGLSDA